MKHYNLPVVIEHDKDGYVAWCPSLQGCHSQGETYEEVLTNIKDAMQLHIEDLIAEREEIPAADLVSLSAVEVAV